MILWHQHEYNRDRLYIAMEKDGVHMEKLRQRKQARSSTKGAVTRKENELLSIMSDFSEDNMYLARQKVTEIVEAMKGF